MTTQRISSINLLRETLAVVGSIYPDLFRINYPHLIYFGVNTFGRYAMLNSLDITITTQELDSFSVYWHIFYWCVVVPFLFGTTTFYSYRSFTGNQVTANDAFTQSKRRLLPLIGVYFLFVVLILGLAGIMWFVQSFAFDFWVYGGYHITDYCSRFLDAFGVRICGLFIITANSGEPIFLGLMLLVIIPGLYVSYRLIFSSYATVIDNNSVLDSFNSSWELTKGRWWLVFRSNLLISFVFFVPAVLLSGLIGSTWENLLGSQFVGNILGLIAGLLMNVYLVLLYLRLRESAATIQ